MQASTSSAAPSISSASLLTRGRLVGLGERRADPGRDDAPLRPARVLHGVAENVHAAALGRGAQPAAGRGLPAWASEITRLTPRSPRRLKERRNAVPKGSASELPTVAPSTARLPCVPPAVRPACRA